MQITGAPLRNRPMHETETTNWEPLITNPWEHRCIWMFAVQPSTFGIKNPFKANFGNIGWSIRREFKPNSDTELLLTFDSNFERNMAVTGISGMIRRFPCVFQSSPYWLVELSSSPTCPSLTVLSLLPPASLLIRHDIWISFGVRHNIWSPIQQLLSHSLPLYPHFKTTSTGSIILHATPHNVHSVLHQQYEEHCHLFCP